MRRSKTDFDRAVTMQAEGMTKAAIARTLGVSPSTVSRWLARAGRHAAAFQRAHLEIADPVEYQLDELSCNGVGAARNAWAYSGIEVWSRMWVSLLVGNRTLRSTYLIVRQVAQSMQERRFPLVVTTDKFKYYEPVMKRILGNTRVVYLQIENRYSRRGIVRTESTQVMGTALARQYAEERSEDSKRPNTSYIERLNLRKRMCCSLLRRRNPSPARNPERVQEALEIVRVIYNFVRGHSSLKFGKVKRTPAMQAGIFSRALTVREIFSWVAPPQEERFRQTRRMLAQLT
ncbi:MAG: helix-turn-helix domain-containing protein [Planctomycetota bacterium]